MTQYIVVAYFLINAFTAGLSVGRSEYEPVAQRILPAVIWMLFGCFILQFYWISPAVKWVIHKEERVFQIGFFFNFYFTKKWHRVDKEVLYKVNRWNEQRTSKTLKDRIFRKCVRMINKRNNYTYVYKEPTF